jgi:hypothetical protein
MDYSIGEKLCFIRQKNKRRRRRRESLILIDLSFYKKEPFGYPKNP